MQVVVEGEVPLAAKCVTDGIGKPTRIYRIASTLHIE
jgi:hypothetical protein